MTEIIGRDPELAHVKIVNHAENVPVRWGQDGPVVGTARVSDDGEILLTLSEKGVAQKLYHQLLIGQSHGLFLGPTLTPATPKLTYSEEVRHRFEAANKKEQ